MTRWRRAAAAGTSAPSRWWRLTGNHAVGSTWWRPATGARAVGSTWWRPATGVWAVSSRVGLGPGLWLGLGLGLTACAQPSASSGFAGDVVGSQAESGWWVIQGLTGNGTAGPFAGPASPGADPVVLQLPSDILFATGSSQLSADARQRLADVATEVGRWDGPVTVVGHTDSTGTVAGNEMLGLDRAEAVAVALEELGLPPDRVSVASYGQRCPVATNDTPEGRTRNRRVEVHRQGTATSTICPLPNSSPVDPAAASS